MSIQPKKEYGDIEESRRTFSGSGSSKGIATKGQSQKCKFYQNLNVGSDEVRRSVRISKKNNSDNLRHDVNISEQMGERQNDGAHKTLVMSKCLWSREEDQSLKALVNRYGDSKWSLIARSLNSKTGKQCRERWHNHLRPNIKEQPWTEEEERVLIEMHSMYGNKWVQIAKYIPGRTENAIKNHWNSTKRKNCRKNLLFKGPRPKTLLQQYIETVDQDHHEKNNASNAQPKKQDIPIEKTACVDLNLNQPGMPDAREMTYTGTNYLYQSDFPVAGKLMYACNNPNPYVMPNLGEERFYTGTNYSTLNLYQIMGFHSDEANPARSFTELLGLNVNMYAPQFSSCGRYTFTPNVGPVYFGDDIGSSSSHPPPSEPAEDYYKNMAMVSSEKNASVDPKGKGKMMYLLG